MGKRPNLASSVADGLGLGIGVALLHSGYQVRPVRQMGEVQVQIQILLGGVDPALLQEFLFILPVRTSSD
ncbi:hypothetical protein A4H96_05495 [Acidithiobacillus ferrooxidans]|uniref:Uncharacterized protein n=1 Tax=Acidithiobacillus ferrooxidans TaxID=920 RepID=A0A179BKN6_ACIFR|nr:hypothetical protein A4H96_05495 [Acidithiobacillus ferrooxidans]